jgi:hypothetical protein
VVNGSGKRVTSGQRMVAAAALHDVGRLSQDEAMVWADALARVVEDGQEDAPRVLLARVVDELTAERVLAVLLGRMGRRDSVLAEEVEELYRDAMDVPAEELPDWAEAGIRTPDGLVAFSGHTLDLDAAEAEDRMSWPPITVMVHQVVGTPAAVLLEVGPGGVPCHLLSRQARRIAGSLTKAAELVDSLGGGT